MTEHFPLMIAGGDPVGTLEVSSPYSGATIATVEQAGEQHIEAALASAHALYRDRSSWLNVVQRVEILEKLAEIMASRQEELAQGAAAEGGKPLIDSRVEAARAVAGVKLCIEHISSHAGNVIPMNEPSPQLHRMAFTQHEPRGVVVAVSAFNHPLNLIVHQVGAAVAAGCPVIVKPANLTPLSCFRFVQMLREAGLPDAWCQIAIPKSRDLSTALVTDKRVAFFSFIGSGAVGWSLKSQLAPGTRAALEHGGVAPVIVHESADMAKVVPSVLKGGFYHAGQVCVSVQRVYAPKGKAAELAKKLAEGANTLVVGDSLDDKTEVGPLIQPSEVDRVHQWVQDAVKDGAQLLCGGEALPNNCYRPTVLLNPPDSSTISQNEVFGPVVCVYDYDSVDEACDRANSLPVSFQAAVFSQDIDAAINIYHKLDASAVMVNEHTAFRHDGMPFAGLRESGHGVGGVGHTIEEMQIEKMMVIKSPRL